MWCHKHKPQDPQKTRWLQGRNAEQSAPTYACHTHCASRQLGTTKTCQCGYSSLWRWGPWCRPLYGEASHCKGICSKEDLQCCIQWSVRNPLEQDQVQRALGKMSRSCHRTSNNQPLFTSLEIPLGFLPWVVLHGLSIGLCHARKFELKDYMRKKGMIRDCPTDICTRNLRHKAKMGNKPSTEPTTRVLWTVCFEKTTQCVPETQGHTYNVLPPSAQVMRKLDKKLDSCAAKKGVKKLVCSDCAKILD